MTIEKSDSCFHRWEKEFAHDKQDFTAEPFDSKRPPNLYETSFLPF